MTTLFSFAAEKKTKSNHEMQKDTGDMPLKLDTEHQEAMDVQVTSADICAVIGMLREYGGTVHKKSAGQASTKYYPYLSIGANKIDLIDFYFIPEYLCSGRK